MRLHTTARCFSLKVFFSKLRQNEICKRITYFTGKYRLLKRTLVVVVAVVTVVKVVTVLVFEPHHVMAPSRVADANGARKRTAAANVINTLNPKLV
jgi:hypothetical protein